ncbi:MAG: ABC transporter, substrate-binding protein (cluster 4, leucine/isoleucine/valine/benzoate) [Pseudolabrys sp.]|jgi:branched-chain amino acid transport system substrate-binding protein|nr:ABC transporter, substrate-binding protein (cluster 4, leucine/isoleucine/valine/benzoate) [Pseudolabrys sp.]
MIRKFAGAMLAAATMTFCATGAQAQGTIKIGLIMAYSGQFADTATQMDNAVKLYIKEHGDTIDGKKIELIRKDTGGPNPDVAKRLAQELVVRDKVDILAGFTLTPEALGAAGVSAEAKKFMVVMNAATSIITEKSPYIARTSLTIPQLEFPFGTWAVKHSIKKIYTMVSDYGPGIDAETWFQKGVKQAGGEVVGSVRMPVANPDFSAFVQRAKDVNPDGVFIFIPGGAQPLAITKAFQERGISGDKILGQGEISMDENGLKSMGDLALGIRTVLHYSWEHDSAMNKKFVADYNAEFKRNPDIYSIGGWDGMHLIYAALKKTGGKTDGESLINAAKGMAWESPRGPISIDPKTRDIVQTVYIRKVEKVGGRYENVEIDKIEKVKDPAKPEK